jgi:hypothetical protein
MEELVRRDSDLASSRVTRITRGKHTRNRPLFPTDLQNLMPRLEVCDPIAPLFAFVSPCTRWWAELRFRCAAGGSTARGIHGADSNALKMAF